MTAKVVTGSYFPLLGQSRSLAGFWTSSDDARSDRVAVLTAAFWARRFASDPAVLGRTMTIDGASYTVVGVLQKDVGPLERDVALFTAARWPPPKRKGPFFTTVLGRLRPDVPEAAALDTLRATNARLFPIWKSSYQDEKATWGLQDLKSRVVGDVGSTLRHRAGRGWAACSSSPAPTPSICSSRARSTAAASWPFAARLAPRAAGSCSTLTVESALLTAGAAVVGGGGRRAGDSARDRLRRRLHPARR